jgi:hypothetical protein
VDGRYHVSVWMEGIMFPCEWKVSCFRVDGRYRVSVWMEGIMFPCECLSVRYFHICVCVYNFTKKKVFGYLK